LEVSFVEEIKSLRLGEGDTFHGEGILAVTKALLQSGVAYVGGYQGASVIQERAHAYTLKSTLCLLDLRPNLCLESTRY
jgi:TPP-dependent indolepyruvate ferredoxin oxidoreductase alpha subunit